MSQMRTMRVERQNAYGTSKDQILVAAEDLFSKNGFSRTTLKDVARESGANTALVGYHFGSKDGLRTAVIQRQLELIREELQPVWKAEDASAQDVETLVDSLLNTAARSKTLYCLHLWCLIDEAEQAKQVVEEVYKPLIGCLTNFLSDYWSRQGIQTDAIKAECKAHLIFGIVNQFAISKWHIFEVSGHTTREDFMGCHRNSTRSTLISLMNGN